MTQRPDTRALTHAQAALGRVVGTKRGHPGRHPGHQHGDPSTDACDRRGVRSVCAGFTATTGHAQGSR